MAGSRWQRLLLIATALQVGLVSCSTPSRLPAVPEASALQAGQSLGPIRFLVSRESETFAAEARNMLAREQQWFVSQGKGTDLPPAQFLAISGGGDNGAFGAGLLNGWTASGTRPEFKVVTGVSTGALIAPFAFLGPKYDYVLERVYTQTSQKDIFKKRGLIKGALFNDGMADTAPLAGVIASYVNQQLLDEIAAEYAKGRVLLVGTANLDSLEPVIWNMTAIAASKHPRSIPLFRQILLASASIPGAFPPVMIDVDVGGTRYQEMHVDGGTMAQVFLFPPSLNIAQVGVPSRKRVAYIIRNARMDVDWASVERRTLSITARAIGSLTRTQGIGDLYRIYVTTQKDGIDFNLAYIPPTFTVPHREEFDTNYMQQLYTTGRQMALAGYQWQKTPPGLETLPQTSKPAGN